jgi:hypothetical protein
MVLPKKEFELLYYLAQRPTKFAADELLQKIWGTDVFVVERTVDVHVQCEKIGNDYIKTLKGVGYMFSEVKGEEASNSSTVKSFKNDPFGISSHFWIIFFRFNFSFLITIKVGSKKGRLLRCSSNSRLQRFREIYRNGYNF